MSASGSDRPLRSVSLGKPRLKGVSHNGEVIVLVHGIWMHGVAMSFMGQILKGDGFEIFRVSYDFLGKSPEENAQTLAESLKAFEGKTLHLVGHSLGGIVILHLLKSHPDLNIGKIVLLGSPVKGSAVARRIHGSKLLRPLLGRSSEGGLLGNAPDFDGRRPLGIIAGSGKFGLGALFYPSGEAGDGVVTLRETLLENITDRIELPRSHTAMIFSRECARLVVRFIEQGRFS